MKSLQRVKKKMISLLEKLSKDKNYLICTHVNPDLDAISSLLSLTFVLHNIGFKVSAKLENSPDWMYFLTGWDLFAKLEKLEIPDLYDVIALDCGSKDRVWPNKALDNAGSIINIDHHFDNPLFGSVNICERDVSSTAELLYRLFKQDSIPLNQEIASTLYAGILFDTGGFRYSNTKASTFQTATEMIALGVNPSEMADHVFTFWEKSGFCALQVALANIEYWENNQILYSFVSWKEIQENNLKNEDFEGIIDILRLHRLAKYSILIREIEKGVYKGSVRAKEPYTIGDALRSLGGGGHKRAAGFLTHQISIEEITKTLVNNFNKLL